MNKRTLISLLSFGSFALITMVVLLLANGYRLDRQTNQVYATGILEVKSEPSGASVSLNQAHRGATDMTIDNLAPGTYQLQLTKEGYATWQKDVVIDKTKVTAIDALLVPSNPSLAPITSTSATRPLLSPDGEKLAYVVAEGTAPGIWMLDLTSQPFNLNQKPIQLAADTPQARYSEARLAWSPTSRDLLLSIGEPAMEHYRLNTSNKEIEPVDLSLATLKEGWDREQQNINQQLSAGLPDEGKRLLQEGGSTVVWSPDNLKFLLMKKEGEKHVYYIYNKEAKRQYKTGAFDQNRLAVVRWYSDSQHLLLLEKDRADSETGSVSLMGMDGTNKFQAYSGTLSGDALYAYLSGSKLVILTSFNPQNPNRYLYSINLR
jgi:hypothetical protein